MCDFKLYERVVCIASFNKPGNNPRIGETVTIIDFDLDDNDVFIQVLEYACEFNGEEQTFISTKFERPKILPFENLYQKNTQSL